MSTKSTEEIVLQKHYAELVKLLARCIDDVVLGLVSTGVIDIDQKNVIRKYGDTPGDRVQYLLDNHIARPLCGGVTDHFMNLLDAMKEFPSCDQLVGAIEEDLQTGDAKVKDLLSSSEDDEVETSLDEISKRQEDLNKKIEHLQEEIHELHKRSDSEKSGKEPPEGSNEELSPGDLISDQPTSSIRDYSAINKQGVAMVIDQYGSSNEQLNSPHLLAKRPSGGLICRDSSNQQLILFDEQLQYLHVIGEKGDGNGKFQDISGIAASETCLYVADTVLNCIQKFELTGKFVCQFGSEGEKRGQFNGPSGLLLQSDLLFVCDRYNHRIQVFQNDEFSYTFGESGTEPGTFSRPVDLSVNRTGDQLFITDSDNNRVQVFTPKGDFVKVFGSSVDIPFELQLPFGICVTPDDHVLITAVGTHSLLVFKDDGTFVSTIEGTYQGESRYSYPCGVVVMNNGQIVIADYYGNKLVVL